MDSGAWLATVHGFKKSWMESKKMVLKNLQDSNGEADIEIKLMDMKRGEKRVRCMGRVIWNLHYHM